tara:strand:+ start:1712 stop:1939 length:228 start_codon:yes stop_codon:yes gene_type:complete
MKLTNLFEQLSKENQDKLYNYKHKMIAKGCLNFLKDNNYSIDTPVMMASEILDITRGCNFRVFDLNEFYQLFNKE